MPRGLLHLQMLVISAERRGKEEERQRRELTEKSVKERKEEGVPCEHIYKCSQPLPDERINKK